MRRPYLSLTVGVVASLFVLEFVLLGIAPVSRSAWLLENFLVLVLAIALVLAARHFRLSRVSYLQLLLFLCVHEIGAHYTYSLVPYDAAWESLTGDSLGWERNHFDRLVHFLYGLLLAYPVREFYLRVVSVKGLWGYTLPLGFIMATSMVYELLEWAAALAFGGDVAHDYVGAQGDVWDAHKDMALATLGATISMAITLVANVLLDRDFAAEWAESLRVKHEQPLGEEELTRMLEEREETG